MSFLKVLLCVKMQSGIQKHCGLQRRCFENPTGYLCPLQLLVNLQPGAAVLDKFISDLNVMAELFATGYFKQCAEDPKKEVKARI